MYGCEAILPLEIQIPSLRTTLVMTMMTDSIHQHRLEELEELDEKKLQAQKSNKLYQARISKAFNGKVKHKVFHQGNLVLTVG